MPPPDRWLLSYADFVTLLLAVFVVLLASVWHHSLALTTAGHSSSVNASAGVPQSSASSPSSSPPKMRQPSPAEKSPLRQVDSAALMRELKGVLGGAMDRDEIVLHETSEGLIISFRELGSFNSGQATLLPGAAETLRSTGKVLMQHGLEIRVEGHSDDQPIHTATFDSNWQLSTARAMSVLRLLLEGVGFPPEKASVAGYGPYHPVAENTSAQGRRLNRRVDLVVLAPRTKQDSPLTQDAIPKPNPVTPGN